MIIINKVFPDQIKYSSSRFWNVMSSWNVNPNENNVLLLFLEKNPEEITIRHIDPTKKYHYRFFNVNELKFKPLNSYNPIKSDEMSFSFARNNITTEFISIINEGSFNPPHDKGALIVGWKT